MRFIQRLACVPRYLVLIPCILVFSFTGCGNDDDGGGGGGPAGPSSNDTTPSMPRNLKIESAGIGERILLTWDLPIHDDNDNNDPDEYSVTYTSESNGIGTTYIVEADEFEFTYYPDGDLGAFELRAENDAGSSDPLSQLLQRCGWAAPNPIYVPLVDIHDEPGLGESGVHWVPNSTLTCYYPESMTESADNVDFYMTNFNEDNITLPFHFASPDLAPLSFADSLVISTIENLRHTEFIDLGLTAPDLVPHPAVEDYFGSTGMMEGHYYGVHMEDDYFGVIYLHEFTVDGGLQTQIRIWMQPIQGCRIFGLSTIPADPPKN